MMIRAWLVLSTLLCSSALAQWKKLTMDPPVAYIRGAGGTHAITFTGERYDGTEADVTSLVRVVLDDPSILKQKETGLFEATKEGVVKIRATLGTITAQGAVVVQPRRTMDMDFTSDVAPIFSKLGCNSSNCHGALNGQKGFKLSLFGYDPDADYRAIVEDASGRRIDAANPEKSLLLLKPTFAVPHGGGQLLTKEPHAGDYRTILEWIRAKTPNGSTGGPRLARLEVYPGRFRILKKDQTQRIVVVGHYSDGSREDLTRLVRYTSNNESSISVSAQGQLTAKQPGEATILIRTLGQVSALRAGVANPDKVAASTIQPANFIDEIVFRKLAGLNIEVSDLSTGPEFLRRVYLDLTGLPPTVDQARKYIADTTPDKRQRLIDQLLPRHEVADFWAAKWGDLLSNNLTEVVDSTAFLQDWLRESFYANKPYDQFVRELLTALGSTWESGAANFHARPPEDSVATTALAFLGVSLECAKCHDHPSEKWKREDFIGMSAFFSQVADKGKRAGPVHSIKYLVYDREYRHPQTRQIVKPRLLDGSEPIIRPLEDRRVALADWVTSPKNPWFARATVNRVWKQLMGRGLVEPADDFRITNPPVNQELLDRLAADFVGHQFDFRHLLRVITSSATYQLSSMPKPSNRSDELNYSRYYLKRLTGEQMIDSLMQITGVPEKFRGYYPGVRAVNLADPGVPSRFLDMYDRPKRDAAKCERNDQVSLSQAVNMLAGDTLNEKIRSPKGVLSRMTAAGAPDSEILEHFYLAAFSRFPHAAEKELAAKVLGGPAGREKGLQNVVWSLLNTNEFLYNH
ncbi:MAG: DUF1553 domain-containing protein [Bryobacteraceae bacterium]|nr:DUF1553 domain-containing protein [Bryobacteraceae bacterium]